MPGFSKEGKEERLKLRSSTARKEKMRFVILDDQAKSRSFKSS